MSDSICCRPHSQVWNQPCGSLGLGLTVNLLLALAWTAPDIALLHDWDLNSMPHPKLSASFCVVCLG